MKKLIISALCLIFAGAAFAQSAEETRLIRAWKNYKKVLNEDYRLPEAQKAPIVMLDQKEIYEKEVFQLLSKEVHDLASSLLDIYEILETMYGIAKDKKTKEVCLNGAKTCININDINVNAAVKAKMITEGKENVYPFAARLFTREQMTDGAYKRLKTANAGANVIEAQAYYLLSRHIQIEDGAVGEEYLLAHKAAAAAVFKKDKEIAEILNGQLQKLLKGQKLDAPVINGKSIAQAETKQKLLENLAQGLNGTGNERLNSAVGQLNAAQGLI